MEKKQPKVSYVNRQKVFTWRQSLHITALASFVEVGNGYV